MKKSLLLIAHGTKSEERNQVLSDFMKSVCIEYKYKFQSTKWCFLESSLSITNAVNKLIDTGTTECFVIPLFVAPSSHYNYDIPHLLNSAGRNTINFKISMPYMYSTQLKHSLLNNVSELTEYPDEEGIILFAHGSQDFKNEWDRMLGETGDYLLKNTGISIFNYAYIKNGKNFLTTGLELIEQELQSVNRLLISGVYFGKSILEIFYNHKDELPKYFESYRNEGRISFSRKTLLSGNYVKLWIEALITNYLNYSVNNITGKLTYK